MAHCADPHREIPGSKVPGVVPGNNSRDSWIKSTVYRARRNMTTRMAAQGSAASLAPWSSHTLPSRNRRHQADPLLPNSGVLGVAWKCLPAAAQCHGLPCMHLFSVGHSRGRRAPPRARDTCRTRRHLAARPANGTYNECFAALILPSASGRSKTSFRQRRDNRVAKSTAPCG